MLSRRSLLAGTAALGFAGCSGDPVTRTYDGPQVTRIQVLKQRRVMHVIHNRTLLKAYDVDLGFAPEGHKAREGDGRTPEGAYRINRRNPQSRFHLSLGISYPDINDVAMARANGQDPGGDIFIHGTPLKWQDTPDWTWGCIAISNAEMDELYPMIDLGTPIYIYA